MNLTESEFESLKKKYNIIPLYKEIIADLDTPVGAFVKLNKKPSFLLESVIGGEKWGRYSIIGVDPCISIIVQKRKVKLVKFNSTFIYDDVNPFQFLKDFYKEFRVYQDKNLPRFFIGMVGYISYDTVKLFEKVPDIDKPSVDMPDIFLMVPETVLIFDNLRQSIKIVYNVMVERNIEYKEAETKIDEIIRVLKNHQDERFRTYLTFPEKELRMPIKEFSSNFTKEEFIDIVKKAKEYIYSGDIIQVVLSQRFETNLSRDPFDIYRSLRIINPSPYMFYIDTGDSYLIGSSPEILVRVEEGNITVRPIAGTRPRGKTEQEDIEFERQLLSDEKEKAEHIMLVDLGRNDVGRVAEVGSVNVTELMTIERYSHVMHIVSNVEGKLLEGLDIFDVFMSCFPAGTVTGAPKVRAMQIIEELENIKRGVYAGAIGYFSFTGNMDMCIGIRMLVVKDTKIYIQAGAGIVADSIPENEYNETVSKATAMLKAVNFLGEKI
ncbi:MAG: anthranilate synthase component I [Thermodesulfovibrio sp.]|nr:anthranilate synthase component I [Thermodesulfovibrio sp.]